MSIMSYTGGTIVAMAGDECVCIASDLRIGEQMTTIATDQKKVHKVTDKVYVGLAGFQSDARTVLEKIMFRKNLYELRENRRIKPQVLSEMISNLAYQHRFGSYFTEPLVAGLDDTNKPYICCMDTIGCVSAPRDFVAVGTGQEYLLGVCEMESKVGRVYFILEDVLMGERRKDSEENLRMKSFIRIYSPSKTFLLPHFQTSVYSIIMLLGSDGSFSSKVYNNQ
ncbi:hypothetical protein CAEBREN_25310 [Caenorhabditis brenneri]|uniref:Proteasome subunit beta n=1 Tax=Caenorhabditis brenneri TaxID=135651 RepID=G0MPW8_CAEBE|nr:hypothetical protein CAEBREN_25310 [Caenorhabditis brenneri]